MSTLEPEFVKARAKVLAREDRELKAALIRTRQESGLSQKDVAEIMGVSQQAIHKLERYDSDPKASTMRRYANALGAMYEHRVHRDHGQSAWLATRRRWETAKKTSLPVEPPAAAATLPVVRQWRTVKQSDVGLAG
ncbi:MULTISPECIES: helix-turn-helix domain-containing protein [unclassified Brevibacterium]|uniref:helix-turn-helix domain-containing protein n=1 Tax=unclassified Brevibacterium TaxID=2614124 RepID=UPI0010926C2A|nr:helix-turn-helix transcriptional regulator [Brevibacterium sp. S22]TGD29720.1 XRE family transcriptional regulator [Brevibacterium sp. S22]